MGILVGTPSTGATVFGPTRRESDSTVAQEVAKLRNGNNRPTSQAPTQHKIFRKRDNNPNNFVLRQNSYIPDSNVPIVTTSFLVENNKFRKHVFEDGTITVAPKGYLMGGAVNNGDPSQGVDTVFIPGAATENAGFV
jgi:hypothetical protein